MAGKRAFRPIALARRRQEKTPWVTSTSGRCSVVQFARSDTVHAARFEVVSCPSLLSVRPLHSSQLGGIEPDCLRERCPVLPRSEVDLLPNDQPVAYLQAVRDRLLH
jgi:hypothetical protein